VKLDYATAQLMIDSKASGEGYEIQHLEPELQNALNGDSSSERSSMLPTGGHSVRDIMEDVRSLHKVATQRRKHRFDTGSLSLHNAKLAFKLDDNSNPTEFSAYAHHQSNELVEEYMLLANMTVAQHLLDRCPELALLRGHPSPDEEGLSKVVSQLNALGVEVDASSSGALHRSLKRFSSAHYNGVNIQSLLETMFTIPMQPARYLCAGVHSPADFHHYALNFAVYTHFTSPIRRYADVIVHRVLQYVLELESNTPNCKPPALNSQSVEVQAEHCNTRKAAAKAAQEQSSLVFLWSVLRTHYNGSFVTHGMVMDMGEKSCFVLIPHMNIKRQVYYDKIFAQAVDKVQGKPSLTIQFHSSSSSDKDGQASSGGATHTYTIFDKVVCCLYGSQQAPCAVHIAVLPPHTPLTK